METSSQRQGLVSMWFSWHFLEAPAFLWQAWNNYLNYAINLFSVGLLLKTFFAPWHRYNWSYPKVFDITGFFNTLISNIISRLLGAMMRTVLILVGFLLQIIVAISGMMIFFGWLLLPFIVMAGMFFVFFVN